MLILTTILNWYHHHLLPSLTALQETKANQGFLVAGGQAINWTVVWITCQIVYVYTQLQLKYQQHCATGEPVKTLLVRISHDEGATSWNRGTQQVKEELDLLRTADQGTNLKNIRIHFTQGDKKGVRYISQGGVELAAVSPEELDVTDSIQRKALCVVRKREQQELDVTGLVNQYLTVTSNTMIQLDGLENSDYSPVFSVGDTILLIDTEAKQHSLQITSEKPSYLLVTAEGHLVLSHYPEITRSTPQGTNASSNSEDDEAVL